MRTNVAYFVSMLANVGCSFFARAQMLYVCVSIVTNHKRWLFVVRMRTLLHAFVIVVANHTSWLFVVRVRINVHASISMVTNHRYSMFIVRMRPSDACFR